MAPSSDIERLMREAAALRERVREENAQARREERERRIRAAEKRRAVKKLERRAARAACSVRVVKTRVAERAKCAKKKAPSKPKERKQTAARRIKPRPVAPGAREPEMLGEVVRPKALPAARAPLALPPAPPLKKRKVSGIKRRKGGVLAATPAQRRKAAVQKPTPSSANDRTTRLLRDVAERKYKDLGERHAYTGTVHGVAAVLAERGVRVDPKRLATIFHDPLSGIDPMKSDVADIAKSIASVVRRDLERPDYWREPRTPHTEISNRTIAKFHDFGLQVANKLRSERIRLNTRAAKKFYDTYRNQVVARIKESIAAGVKSAQETARDSAAKMLADYLPKLETEARVLNETVDIIKSLHAAAGIPLDAATSKLMRAKKEQLAERIATVKSLADYVRRRADNLNQDEIFRDGLEQNKYLKPLLDVAEVASAQDVAGSKTDSGQPLSDSEFRRNDGPWFQKKYGLLRTEAEALILHPQRDEIIKWHEAWRDRNPSAPDSSSSRGYLLALVRGEEPMIERWSAKL